MGLANIAVTRSKAKWEKIPTYEDEALPDIIGTDEDGDQHEEPALLR